MYSHRIPEFQRDGGSDGNMHLRTIESWDTLLQCLHKAGKGSMSAGKTGGEREEFTLTRDYAHALEIAQVGWTEHADKIMDEAKKFASDPRLSALNEAAWSRPLPSYHGRINVPAHLRGDVKSMRKRKRFYKPGSGISLVSAGCFNAHISTEQIIARGSIAARVALAIRSRGIPCTIDVAVHSGWTHPQTRFLAHRIRVNRTNDPIDPARIAFALAHPAMLRRAWFRLAELEDAEIQRQIHIGGGYGMAMGTHAECMDSHMPSFPGENSRIVFMPGTLNMQEFEREAIAAIQSCAMDNSMEGVQS